jgi:ferredoxin
VAVGEGTNSGFYRNRISVITRLKVDELCRHHGVTVLDLNYSRPHLIDFADGVKAQVAWEVVEAARDGLLINLPKLKTHFEMTMSVCLKNLMGTLVGQENKKKTHLSLAANILMLNQAVRPQLHIVDALVAMEGLGPTRGTPLRLDTVLVGRDPYLIDLACAAIAGFDHRDIPTLRLAEERGLVSAEHHRAVAALDLPTAGRPFAPPKAGALASFIHSPKRQKYFLAVRQTPLFTYLASTDWFGNLLFKTGLRQDVFDQKEMSCAWLGIDSKACDDCGICADFCPQGRDLPGAIMRQPQGEKGEDCLHCLYCHAVCPRRAILFAGDKGFYAEQERQYDDLIRRMAKSGARPTGKG